jgi:hypothetical protein
LKKSNIALASLITISAIVIPKLIENLNNKKENEEPKEAECESDKIENAAEKKDGEKHKKEIKNKNDNTVRVHNSLININIKLFKYFR